MHLLRDTGRGGEREGGETSANGRGDRGATEKEEGARKKRNEWAEKRKRKGGRGLTVGLIQVRTFVCRAVHIRWQRLIDGLTDGLIRTH